MTKNETKIALILWTNPKIKTKLPLHQKRLYIIKKINIKLILLCLKALVSVQVLNRVQKRVMYQVIKLEVVLVQRWKEAVAAVVVAVPSYQSYHQINLKKKRRSVNLKKFLTTEKVAYILFFLYKTWVLFMGSMLIDCSIKINFSEKYK